MADNTENPVRKFPKPIAKAVINVMASLGTLVKDKNNKFEGYKFASIDDFIEFVREPMYSNGIFFIPHEKEKPEWIEMQTKDGKPKMMAETRFEFWIVHEEGDMFGPIDKTVRLAAGGAQASGGAQSYATKQIMRGLFQIPTGDKDDPDTNDNAELSTAKEAGTNLQEVAQRIVGRLKNAKSMKQLMAFWNDAQTILNLEDIDAKSPKASASIKALFEERKKALTGEKK